MSKLLRNLTAAAALAAPAAALAGPTSLSGFNTVFPTAENGGGGEVAQIVYNFTGDGVTGGLYDTSRPNHLGDLGTLEPALGPNQAYSVTEIVIGRVNGDTAGSVDVGWFLYDDVNTSATGDVFGGLEASGSFNRAINSTNFNAAFTTSITFTPGTLILDDADFGFRMVFAEAGSINLTTAAFTPTATRTTGFFQSDSGIGTGANGFYSDADGDAALESGEFFVFGDPADPRSNLYLRITADIVTVPEPTGLGLAAVAGLGLLRRRRA